MKGGICLKIRNIFIVTLMIFVLFIAAEILMGIFPSESRRKYTHLTYTTSEQKKIIDNHWAYYLINRENPLDKDFTVALELVQGSFMMDSRCAPYARQMIEDAEKDGIHLKVVSAYRSIVKQQENLESYTARLMQSGYNEKEARAAAENEIALPFTSEHNAGLSLDILTENWWETHDDVTADFENTKEFEWLVENAYKYGFIMRYPKEYENVTGYTYEPWHYRFVGLYYAEKIKESGLPFEYFYKTNF